MHQACSDLQIIANKPLCDGPIWKLTLSLPDWDHYTPGQFVMLRPMSWQSDPILPRPFSIAHLDSQGLHFFYHAVGKGTTLLTKEPKGQAVTVWGPLGKGFKLKNNIPALLLAGGMGIAPFVGLVESWKDCAPLEMVFGHRLPLSCYPFKQIEQTISATSDEQHSMDDIHAFLQSIDLKLGDYRDRQVLICGPTPFMAAVQKMCLEKNIQGQLSLEKKMACGVGACLGCVVKDSKGDFIQSCTRGPVFFTHEVEL